MREKRYKAVCWVQDRDVLLAWQRVSESTGQREGTRQRARWRRPEFPRWSLVEPPTSEPSRECTLSTSACIICLDAEPEPIQSGCACRGDAGLAHVKCRAEAATHRQQSTGISNEFRMVQVRDFWAKFHWCYEDGTGGDVVWHGVRST